MARLRRVLFHVELMASASTVEMVKNGTLSRN